MATLAYYVEATKIAVYEYHNKTIIDKSSEEFIVGIGRIMEKITDKWFPNNSFSIRETRAGLYWQVRVGFTVGTMSLEIWFTAQEADTNPPIQVVEPSSADVIKANTLAWTQEIQGERGAYLITKYQRLSRMTRKPIFSIEENGKFGVDWNELLKAKDRFLEGKGDESDAVAALVWSIKNYT